MQNFQAMAFLKLYLEYSKAFFSAEKLLKGLVCQTHFMLSLSLFKQIPRLGALKYQIFWAEPCHKKNCLYVQIVSIVADTAENIAC